ncbi:hypothetical protein UFOVP1323_51 [uncultured Caudovirales phage]|uniref:Uncharacterized protein n=1 Tax=uncultured Caudovirales phage TaxID=2100421 RepID=A0A6J5RP83_9CAUD|nr:hypothetical protein UFOVP1323_51 [uncultured Caudovirales phage]
MKKEIADLWIAALKSGEYAQTTETLQRVVAKTENDREILPGFCCLGVLCEVAIKHGLKITKELDRISNSFMWYDSSRDYIPPVVQEWSGMKSQSGEFRYDVGLDEYSTKGELTVINDSGKTFEEIAEIIHENWEKL